MSIVAEEVGFPAGRAGDSPCLSALNEIHGERGRLSIMIASDGGYVLFRLDRKYMSFRRKTAD